MIKIKNAWGPWGPWGPNPMAFYFSHKKKVDKKNALIFTIEIINLLKLTIRGFCGSGRRRRRSRRRRRRRRRSELKLCGVVADSIEIICRR